MPQIEQLDWDKLKPRTPEVKQTYAKPIKYKLKKTWKPTLKKVKLDPRIAYEQHLQREHLRNIKHELDIS